VTHINRPPSHVQVASRLHGGLEAHNRRWSLHEPWTTPLAELFLFEQGYRFNIDFGGTQRARVSSKMLLKFVNQESLHLFLYLMPFQVIIEKLLFFEVSLLNLLDKLRIELFKRNKIQRLIIGKLLCLDSDTLGLEFFET